MSGDIGIRASRDGDHAALLAVWRSAMRATHTFLDPADFERIERDVADRYLVGRGFLVAVDAGDRPVGFLGLDGQHIDMLFVAAEGRGRGIGKALVMHAAAIAGPLSVDVNEQNGQAVGFYGHMGFRQTGRSPVDDAGRPYPLLHMRMDAASPAAPAAGQM